jgi:hypothetical protein
MREATDAAGVPSSSSIDRSGSCTAAVRHETREVLLHQLDFTLARGHWRVAIRRFLMLTVCGFEVPDDLAQACEALTLSCPKGDLQRIRCQVQSWFDMLRPSPPGLVQLGVPVDKFDYLHAISRPAKRAASIGRAE